MNGEGKRKIIGESRANKYIIPFSRKEVRVGDYILFWYDESDNKGTKWEVKKGRRVRRHITDIDYDKRQVLINGHMVSDLSRYHEISIDRTPNSITSACNTIAGWLGL